MRKQIIVLLVFLFPLTIYSQSWIEYYKKTKECIQNSDYKEGIKYAEKSVEEAGKLFGTNDSIYAECLNDLGTFYRHLGKYDKAEQLFVSALRIWKESAGDNNEGYCKILNNAAVLYKETARYYEAEKSYLYVKNIFEKIYSEESAFVAIIMNNLGTLYMEMGQYLKAEPLFEKTLKIYKETIGEDHIYYMNCLHNYAALCVRMNQRDKAESLYLKSLELKKKIYGKNHPDYALSLSDLAGIYVDKGDFKKAEKLYEEAKSLILKNSDEQNSSYALVLNGLARVYSETGKFKEAEKLFKNVLEIDKVIYGENHPEYLTDLSNLAEMYDNSKDYLKADEIYRIVIAGTLSYVYNCYEYLSERERILLMITLYGRFNRFYSFASKYINLNPVLAEEMLNLRLSVKGIATGSTINVKNRILKTEDTILLGQYRKFIEIQELISKAYVLSPAELKSYNINLELLKEKSNELEKEIVKKSGFENIKSGNIISDWKDIQKNIKDNEAAIEYIDFEYFDGQQSDTNYYCALIILKGSKYPYFVKLCNESEIENILKKTGSDNFSKSNYASNKLYELLFSPLEIYLKNINTVFISSSGLINKITFTGLSTGENEYLFDRYNLRFFSNLKDITEEENTILNKDNQYSLILGGLQFDLDSVTAFSMSQKFSRGDDWTPPNNVTYNEIPKLNVNKWDYLPGTLGEVNFIKSIFEKNNFSYKLLTGTDASKFAFKYEINNKTPYLIHIASHGYFYPSPFVYTKKGIDISQIGGNKFQLSMNALIRSGIILSGANRIWLGGEEIEGIDNGVLTSMEISNLDLFNTQLVVLSACETGLGDIYSEEGVFGLQRAFKIAGAKSIIISMWKVPDKETVELMELFYTNWIEKGMKKYEALNSAQREMKARGYEPYYWAAFIMLE